MSSDDHEMRKLDGLIAEANERNVREFQRATAFSEAFQRFFTGGMAGVRSQPASSTGQEGSRSEGTGASETHPQANKDREAQRPDHTKGP